MRVILVEGEIAAGKSVLTEALAAALRARGLRVCAVPEPVEEWRAAGILQAFYADPPRYAYSFQTFVFVTRVRAIAAAVAAAPDAEVLLLERSPATDQIFMALQDASPVERAMYRTWCDTYTALLPLDLAAARVLYLAPALETCMARLAARCREGEVSGVSPGYQARLRRGHEAFFLGRHPGEFPALPASPFPRENVAVVGPELADKNFRDPGPERDAVLAAILALAGY